MSCLYKGWCVCICFCEQRQEMYLWSTLDRIDIQIKMPKLSGDRLGETSESIRKRVQAARDIQTQRYSKIESSNIVCNADMRIGEVRQFCVLQPEGQSLMGSAMSQFNLSARAYHRILKLSRTIADLSGSAEIQSPHLVGALQYRPKLIHSTIRWDK